MDQLATLRSTLDERYQIERELGAGAMATVFLAHDFKHDRNVALKVLRPELTHSLDKERFFREIRLAARLTHPHILPLFDSGVASDVLYYVMPNAEGQSLRDRLHRQGPLPVAEAVRIAHEVAMALDYAHRQSVIHRDIKPDNIMLLDGHAMVADFGIAKALGTADSDRMTQTGASVGTAAYVSPEQAAGDSVDGRSDIYSLGCVLYEMLTGEPPFIGLTLQAVIAKRFTQPAPDVTSLREGVPRAVADAVQRALARNAADRFDDAAQFVDALSKFSATVAYSTAPDKSVAVLPFTNMSADPENEYFAAGVSEEILNALAQASDLKVAGPTSSFSFKGRNQDLRSIGEQLNVRTVLEGSVRRSGKRVRITAQLISVKDGYHLWSERYDREIEDVFEVQDEIATAIAERLQGTLRQGRRAVRDQRTPASIEAYEAYLRGRAVLYKRGSDIREAMALMQRAASLDPGFALAWAGVADAYSGLSFYCALAPELIGPSARAAAEQAITLGPDVAESQCAAAMVSLLCDWDWPLAQQRFLRADQLNPSFVQSGAWYGFVYLGLLGGRFAEGAELIMRKHELEPLSANTMVFLSLTLGHCSGRSGEAVAWAQRALELEPTFFFTKYGLQLALLLDGQRDASIAAGERLTQTEGRVPISLAVLAVALAESGDLAGARTIRDELASRAAYEYIAPSLRALVQAAVGETESAIFLAREGLVRKDPAFIFGPLGGAWGEVLRALPQFRELTATLKLPGG
ncbi:MAG: protein kinase [Gemmatimonadaceae bacterium]